MLNKFAACALVALGLLGAASAQTAAPQSAGYKVEETRLGPWRSNMGDHRNGPLFSDVNVVRFSRDGAHVAYVYRDENGVARVVLDGKMGPEYYSIRSHLVFSDDGKHLAYVASAQAFRHDEGRLVPTGNNQKSVVVLDGHVSAEYDFLLDLEPILSADGAHIAFAAQNGKNRLVVVDDKPGPEYDLIQPSYGTCLKSSPYGQHLAYAARKDNKWTLVLDGKPGEEYDGFVSPPMFSPDGKHMAYQVRKGEKSFVIVDGQPGAEWDGIGHEAFSADSRHFAYQALKCEGAVCVECVVLDGQPGAEHGEFEGQAAEMLLYYPLLFSPDGRHLAYPLKKAGKDRVVADGKPGAEYDLVGAVAFSLDSQHLAYRAFTRKSEKAWSERLVVDGQPGAESAEFSQGDQNDSFYAPLPLVFSPDGRRIAYQVVRNGKGSLTVDGNAGPEYAWVSDGVFSSDSRRVAYVASNEKKKRFVVVDGQPGAEYDMVSPPTFSPDGKSVAYAAWLDKKPTVILNGKVAAEYDGIACGGPMMGNGWSYGNGPRFASDGTLEYLATKGDSLYRVKHVPAP